MARPKRVRKSPDSRLVPGSPGYRLRQGRSGLDPVDNRLEFGAFLGQFLRQLFTGRVRTRNPAYLIGMTVIGLCLTSPLVVLLASTAAPVSSPATSNPRGPWLSGITALGTMGLLVMVTVVGIALLLTVVINLFSRRR